MKKSLTILLLAAVLLLCGCGEPVSLAELPADSTTSPSEADTTSTTEESTEPQSTEVYFIKKQVYFDANGNELVNMTTVLNDAQLPETILTVSGKDLTHTIFYDDQGVITGFQQIESLYGDNHTTVSKVNNQGHVIRQTTEAGTSKESSIDTVYAYDSKGNIVQKDQTKGGAFYSSETRKYDQDGNLISKETLSADHVKTTYTYTYNNGLLEKSQKTVADEVTETITYTYDESGKLTEKKVNGSQLYVYTYNQNGVLEKLVVTKGIYVNYCRYNENGKVAEQRNYTDGNLTSKIVYVWEEFATEPTQAQLNVFDQLGLL